MTDQELILAIIFWCCVNAVIGYAIGKHKNEVGAAITVLILFGPIGWFLIVLSRGNLRKCPFCAEQVKPEAVLCKHCGNKLPPPEPPSPTKKRVAIGLGIIVTVAVGLILLLVFVPSRLYQPLPTNPSPAITAASDSGTPPTPTPHNSPPPPEFITITKSTEARIPDTFEVITLKPGEQLRFVSLKGDQVRVQYGKFQAVVTLYATDLNQATH